MAVEFSPTVQKFLELRNALSPQLAPYAPPAVPAGAAAAPTFSGTLDPDEAWIISHESGGRTTAKNPHSTAFGVGQLIRSNRQFYAKKYGWNPDTTDYNQQLQLFRDYVKNRYGSAANAHRFWVQHGWY